MTVGLEIVNDLCECGALATVDARVAVARGSATCAGSSFHFSIGALAIRETITFLNAS